MIKKTKRYKNLPFPIWLNFHKFSFLWILFVICYMFSTVIYLLSSELIAGMIPDFDVNMVKIVLDE